MRRSFRPSISFFLVSSRNNDISIVIPLYSRDNSKPAAVISSSILQNFISANW